MCWRHCRPAVTPPEHLLVMINEGPLRTHFQTTLNLLRHFGPGWVMFRLGYALRKRSGALRRTLPTTSWDEQPLERFVSDDRLAEPDEYESYRRDVDRRFFFDVSLRETVADQFKVWDAGQSGPVVIAEALKQGVFRFFEHHEINLGLPPNWHHNPITGDEFPRDRHWTEIGDFAAGDIKLVWEPNRFAWVYPLVRAYWRTGDESYPQLFWELLEDWKATNPPQQGINWKCGQEVAIRSMACCFALYGFADSPATTPQHIASLAQLMAVSAMRIEKNLSYALSQQNNHGITEATALWTIGLLFPEFQDSQRWTQLARHSLEQQTRNLIDDDGAFSQHSVNYQRVMLDACLWAIRLGEVNHQPFSEEMWEKVISAGDFLWQLQDESSGRLPRYGQNDGALLLPLTNCGADDYQPVIQATALLNGHRRHESGSWDEASFWLHGPNSLSASVKGETRQDWHGAAGGYQILRAESGHIATRAPRYMYRPAHADALHVDLWWRGVNVAIDAGTYSYNAAAPWNNPLAGTACHNTVMVDGRDQMDRVGRFLWLPWLSGQRTAYAKSSDGSLTYWEGTHDGYQRLSDPVRHSRGIVRIGTDHWLVIDSLSSRGEHDYQLHWLLPDLPYVEDETHSLLRMETSAGAYQVAVASPSSMAMSLIRADDASSQGWFAPNYSDRQPALSLVYETTGTNVVIATLLGPMGGGVTVSDDQIDITTTEWSCRVDLVGTGTSSKTFCREISVEGSLKDRLTLEKPQPGTSESLLNAPTSS